LKAETLVKKRGRTMIVTLSKFTNGMADAVQRVFDVFSS
jgi:hypothetical protein